MMKRMTLMTTMLRIRTLRTGTLSPSWLLGIFKADPDLGLPESFIGFTTPEQIPDAENLQSHAPLLPPAMVAGS